MNRPGKILAALEAARSMSVEDLAATLNVGRRTISNEVAALQENLGAVASLEFTHGRYRLLIADPTRYRLAKQALHGDDSSFNDPATRVSHIIGALFRALVPVRMEELAIQVAVGRTTVVADLVRVREVAAEADLVVEGRPNVGLTLQGPELQQRLLVLRRYFDVAYPVGGQHLRVQQVVEQAMAEVGLHHGGAAEITRWAVVALERVRQGRSIACLPSRYAGVRETPSYTFATSLASMLSQEFDLDIDGDEIVFLALPVTGMRAPDDARSAEAFNQVGEAESLVDDVLTAIRSEMEINLAGREFLEEFARHVSYMVNRMRYGIWVDDSGLAKIGDEFPLAHRMAILASQVIERQIGLPVDGPEVGLLTAYFQVFLESHPDQNPELLRVVVVANNGRVAAELLRLQLAKVLPLSTQIRVVPLMEATIDGLADARLVVVTGEDSIECDAPVLHVSQVLDRAALERQLERLRLHLYLPRVSGQGGSVLAGAMDKAHFFAFPSGTDYPEVVDFMTGHLEARGLVEADFGERIREREAQAQMQLDPWVAFPHATLQNQSSVMLAVGVVNRDNTEDGVRLVVLLGVPSNPGWSEGILVQVYDEVLRLGARRDLLAQVCQLTSFEDFYYFMENNPYSEGER